MNASYEKVLERCDRQCDVSSEVETYIFDNFFYPLKSNAIKNQGKPLFPYQDTSFPCYRPTRNQSTIKPHQDTIEKKEWVKKRKKKTPLRQVQTPIWVYASLLTRRRVLNQRPPSPVRFGHFTLGYKHMAPSLEEMKPLDNKMFRRMKIEAKRPLPRSCKQTSRQRRRANRGIRLIRIKGVLREEPKSD